MKNFKSPSTVSVKNSLYRRYIMANVKEKEKKINNIRRKYESGNLVIYSDYPIGSDNKLTVIYCWSAGNKCQNKIEYISVGESSWTFPSSFTSGGNTYRYNTFHLDNYSDDDYDYVRNT